MTNTTTTTYRPGRAAADGIRGSRPYAITRPTDGPTIGTITCAGETFTMGLDSVWSDATGREVDASAAATFGRAFWSGRP